MQVGDDFYVHMYWCGTDRDGVVERFVWAWNNATDWNWTTRTDSVFVLSVPGLHVFFMAAIDDCGTQDPTPETEQIFIPYLDR